MRQRIAAVLLLVLAAFALPAAFAIEAELGFDDPAMNARYRALLKEVRCPKCLNTSIADSNAPISADLRREVHEKMNEGYSDEEIVAFLVSRYGDFVVYRPPLQPTTWVLWAGPAVLLGVGAIVFLRISRDRASRPLDEDSIS